MPPGHKLESFNTYSTSKQEMYLQSMQVYIHFEGQCFQNLFGLRGRAKDDEAVLTEWAYQTNFILKKGH